jgi:hypothetical protein
LGWKSFDRVVVGGGLVGWGRRMIDRGGPWPPPSCAIATLVSADAVTNRARTAHFIFKLLRTLAIDGASDMSTRSIANVAGSSLRENAPYLGSVLKDSRLSPAPALRNRSPAAETRKA